MELRLERDGRRQTIAQVAHARFVKTCAHLVHRGEVVAPEGGVAAIEDGQRIGGQRVGDRLSQGGRMHGGLGVLGHDGQLGLITRAHRPHLAQPGRVGTGRVALDRREQIAQGLTGVRLDRHLVDRRAAQGRRVDVDVDQLVAAAGQRAVFVPHPGGPAAAHAQDHVGSLESALDRFTGDDAAMANEVFVARGHHAQGHLRRHHRGTQALGQLAQQLLRASCDHTTATHQKRSAGLQQQLGGFGDGSS